MTTANKTKEFCDRRCTPCSMGASVVDFDRARLLLGELAPGWRVTGEGHLEREFKFLDFKNALAFVNCVGAVAESEHHHPDIYLKWGSVKVMLWTHKINGLSENDFIIAARIEKVFAGS
jgi:4a-hydroxytetrahydrobiopterin dehydratase